MRGKRAGVGEAGHWTWLGWLERRPRLRSLKVREEGGGRTQVGRRCFPALQAFPAEEGMPRSAKPCPLVRRGALLGLLLWWIPSPKASSRSILASPVPVWKALLPGSAEGGRTGSALLSLPPPSRMCAEFGNPRAQSGGEEGGGGSPHASPELQQLLEVTHMEHDPLGTPLKGCGDPWGLRPPI